MEEVKRAFWNKGNSLEPCCDLSDYPAIHKRVWGMFVSSFRRTPCGYPMSRLKCDENVGLFAMKAELLIRGMLRIVDTCGWCIITTPRRRNRENHFATNVCRVISADIGVPFYEDAVIARSRHRVGAEFELTREIGERNVIIYDDILTTGSTAHSMIRLLKDRNIFVVIGVNNN